MKFAHKLTIVVAVLIMITVGTLSVRQYMTVKSNLFSTIDQSLDDIIGNVTNSIVGELEGKKQLAKFIAERVSNEGSSIDSIQGLLDSQVVKTAFVQTGVSLESTGKLRVSNDGTETSVNNIGWYQKAKTNQDLFVTDPYTDPMTQQVAVSIVTPLWTEGTFIGALNFNIDLVRLAELTNRVNMFGAGYIQLVTSSGTIVVHPDKKMDGKKLSTNHPDIKVAQQLQIKFIDGVEFGFNFFQIPNEDWYVSSVLNHTIAFKAINDTKTDAIIMSVLALIISIVIFLFLVGKLMNPIRLLNTAIQDISSGQGDLTKRLSTKTDTEFAELAGGFNTFTENLQGEVTELRSIADNILDGANQASQRSTSSTHALNNQVAELEQLATAMNEMAATSSDVAGNAQSAASLVKEADDASQEGVHVVSYTRNSIDNLASSIDDAVAQIETLENATNSIESVLQVINEIADQTNLLALNAAIEAARAGDHGRGFAVVADEVRTLAQRTQVSTTEIKEMIEQLQSGAKTVAHAMSSSKETANDSVNKAREADESLTKIRDTIQQIADMNIQIASAAEEQSLVAEEINANTTKIKELSEEVSSSANETNNIMAQQSERSIKQNEILNRFIV
ncbi:methyl-accepting chemotaxis protein [Vibrio sp. RC27]